MDIKSIVRAFRYGELQKKSENDPEARQPPTIKFLGAIVAIGIVALAFGLIAMNYEPSTNSAGHVMSEPSPGLTTTPNVGNSTAAPTTPMLGVAGAQHPPR